MIGRLLHSFLKVLSKLVSFTGRPSNFSYPDQRALALILKDPMYMMNSNPDVVFGERSANSMVDLIHICRTISRGDTEHAFKYMKIWFANHNLEGSTYYSSYQLIKAEFRSLKLDSINGVIQRSDYLQNTASIRYRLLQLIDLLKEYED